jgi:hypothetical protein
MIHPFQIIPSQPIWMVPLQTISSLQVVPSHLWAIYSLPVIPLRLVLLPRNYIHLRFPIVPVPRSTLLRWQLLLR